MSSQYRARCLEQKGEECVECGTGDSLVQHHTRFDRKRRGESYEDVIWRLIEEVDAAREEDDSK